MDTFDNARLREDTATNLELAAAAQSFAREILRVRKAAKSYFGDSVLSEPAWNLMLALYAMDGGGGAATSVQSQNVLLFRIQRRTAGWPTFSNMGLSA